MNGLLKKRSIYADIIALAALIAAAAVMLRHAFYGAGTPDESFYLSIPYRVMLGESLVVDEWHVSQFSSFLQYLPLWLYVKIAGSTEGIILFFRILFIFCQFSVSAFIYAKLRKYGAVCAAAAMLLFFLYIPEVVMSIDYYTAGLMATEIISLLLLTVKKENKLTIFAIGVLTAFAVVAEPICAAVYFIYAITVAVYFICVKKKKTEKSYWFLSPSCFLILTAGVAVVAVVFLFYLFYRASLSEIFGNLRNLFSLYEYNLPSASGGGTDMLRFDILLKSFFGASPVVFSLSAAATLALLCDKKRIAHRYFWGTIFALLLAGGYIEIICRGSSDKVVFMFRTYPFFFYSLSCYMLSERKDKRLFCAWLLGAVYVVCLATVSLALEYVGGYGLIVSGVAGMIIINNYYCEVYSGKNTAGELKIKHKYEIKAKSGLVAKYLYAAVAVIAVLSLLAEYGIGFMTLQAADIHAPYLEYDNDRCDVQLTSGPLKGIYVSFEKKKQYNGMLEDLSVIKEKAQGKVFIAALIPFTYLYTEKEYGTFTCWYLMQDLEKYEEYYKQTGAPQYIYIPKQRFFYYDDTSISHYAVTALNYFKSTLNCRVTTSDYGYILEVIG